MVNHVTFGVMEQLNEKRTANDRSCLSRLFFSYKLQGVSIPEPLLALAVNLLGADGMMELDQSVRRDLVNAGIPDTRRSDDADA